MAISRKKKQEFMLNCLSVTTESCILIIYLVCFPVWFTLLIAITDLYVVYFVQHVQFEMQL